MGKAGKQKSQLVKKPTGSRGQHQGGTFKGHKGLKTAAAFKVSSHKALKAKHKTKQVTSNLKWMNPKSSKEQVNKNNASFSTVQQDMVSKAKAATKQVVSRPETKSDEGSRVDVDAAAAQMAFL
ncbi:ribosomal biogenesis factor-like [Diadema setosum]|uniref:ribosomal biogenesis factor-like n=1 Tax=Diadema setosum TaxID=31175 RepID=UPI003B3BD753